MKIEFTKKFLKQFNKLTKKTKLKFHHRVDILLSDPRDEILRFHRLSGRQKDSWSFDVSSDVRVVYDRSFEKSDGVILFQEIGSHSELYL